MAGKTNSTAKLPELSQRVAVSIEKIFSAGDVAQIRRLIREFHWAPQPLIDERIHLDILEICDGRIEKVRELVNLAKIDWRDLIMQAECDAVDGKIVLNARGQTRLAEIAIKKKI